MDEDHLSAGRIKIGLTKVTGRDRWARGCGRRWQKEEKKGSERKDDEG